MASWRSRRDRDLGRYAECLEHITRLQAEIGAELRRSPLQRLKRIQRTMELTTEKNCFNFEWQFVQQYKDLIDELVLEKEYRKFERLKRKLDKTTSKE